MELLEVSVDHVEKTTMRNFEVIRQGCWFYFAVDQPFRPSLAAKERFD